MPVFISLVLAACSSPPTAGFNATVEFGYAPLEVTFSLDSMTDVDSFKWDFGDGTGSNEPEPTHTFMDAGVFTARLTVTRGERISVADTVITVEPGEAGWIVLAGGMDSIAVPSLSTLQLLPSAYDVLGNPIVDPVFIWESHPDAGVIDDSGIFTAGATLGDFKDAVTIQFERLGAVVTQRVWIKIIEGPLYGITVLPNSMDIQVGRNQQFTVRAVDHAGHVLHSASTRFRAVRPGDSIDSNGLFTAGTTASDGETDLLELEIELGEELVRTTISGVIRSGILDQIHVSDPPKSLGIGESYRVTAFATDRFGNELDLDELKWLVTDSGIGSITEEGMFTAGSVARTYEEGLTARGYLNGVEAVASAKVTISPDAPVSLEILPDNDSVPIGAGSPFEVRTLDGYGNVIEIEKELYEYEYSIAGRGHGRGLFIAGYEVGDFKNAITVKLPVRTAGNDEELIVRSHINIRQRSSNIIAIEVVDQDDGGILFLDLEAAQLRSADLRFRNNDAIEISPAWWPDGSRLVYVSSLSGDLQAYTLDITTREIIQLTNVHGGVSMPQISPDGESIVFVHLVKDSWQVYVAPIPLDVKTNPIMLVDASRVSADESAQYILPYWSPDGTELLVSKNNSGEAVQIALLDTSGTKDMEVLALPGSIGFGWTSDGTGLHVGLENKDGTLDLATIDVATLIPTFVDSSLEFVLAAWSPDDSELMAIDQLAGAAWLLDSDATGLRRSVDAEQLPIRMAWRPKEYGDPVPTPSVDDGDFRMLGPGDDPAPPVGALDTDLSYSAVISTDSGKIVLELFDNLAPLTVENFINLARIGFYDGLDFHRVIPGLMSQTGNPPGNGNDGPGYVFNDEFTRELLHDTAGIVSMANVGSNTNGSQFLITHDAANWLDAYDAGVAKNCADDAVLCHPIFGRVVAGLDIVTSMTERDPDVVSTPGVTILSVKINES